MRAPMKWGRGIGVAAMSGLTVMGFVAIPATQAVAAGAAVNVQPRSYPSRLWQPDDLRNGWRPPIMVPVAAPASKWKVQPTPNPTVPNGLLTAVSCWSSSSCTAVGSYENRPG